MRTVSDMAYLLSATCKVSSGPTLQSLTIASCRGVSQLVNVKLQMNRPGCHAHELMLWLRCLRQTPCSPNQVRPTCHDLIHQAAPFLATYGLVLWVAAVPLPHSGWFAKMLNNKWVRRERPDMFALVAGRWPEDPKHKGKVEDEASEAVPYTANLAHCCRQAKAC